MSLDRNWHREQCAKYKSEFAAYKEYAAVLESILRVTCRLHAPLAIVQARPKSLSSFAEKMARKATRYQALGLWPTDLCGARVITETEADAVHVCKWIRENFTIDEANSQDVRLRLSTSEFGYLSVHYVVQLDGAAIQGIQIPLEIAGLKAEIQVRTLLQHAWASINHDRIYKTSLRVPDSLRRDTARVAALLEEADQQFGAVVKALDQYKPHYGAYLSKEQMADEIDMLDTVLANEPGPAPAMHLAQVLRALGDWPRIIETLAPYLGSAQPEVLAEHGHALCRIHQADPHGAEFQRGYQELATAADMSGGPAPTRILAYRAWASERIPDNERTARDHYRAAYEADPGNPFHLASYVEYEIYCGEPLGFRAILRPVFEQAIRTCRAHAAAGIELPWAFLTIARFHLLLDESYPCLHQYAKAIRLGLTEAALRGEIAFIRRIHRGRAVPEEHNWSLKLLLLALQVRTGVAPPGLAAKRTEFVQPVVVLAGGTAAGAESMIQRVREPILQAFEGFGGTVISGGTKAGVAGLAGELPSAARIGYLPRNLPFDVSKDDRYTAHVYSDSPDFGAADALQYWTDLLRAGVRPEDVRVLGIGGGRISAFEYRMALALGAQVAILEPASGSAAILKDDLDWNTDPNLIRLPDDAMTIRAFLMPSKPAMTEAEVDAVARRIHENFLAENRYKTADAAMKPWTELADDLKNSNRLQAERAAGFLERIGYRAERAESPIAVPQLTKSEIETLAEMEHGRWVVERLRSGWRYHEKRDPSKKHSPYLVGWKDLSDEIKGYDRSAVQAWTALLAEAGFAIRRQSS